MEYKKSVLVPFSAKQMFMLVDDINNYHEFLPWCVDSKASARNDDSVVGAVYLEYLKIKFHFVTQNHNTPYSQIKMNLVDGPFKLLHGSWNFTQLGDNGCKVSLELQYQFINPIMDKLIGSVFAKITANLVECFIKQAKIKYKNSN